MPKMHGLSGHRFEPGRFGWRAYDARGRRVRVVKYFWNIDRSAFPVHAINRWKNARVQDWAAREEAMRNLWYQCLYAFAAMLISAPFMLYVIFLPRINLEPSLPLIFFLVTITIILASWFRAQLKPARRQVDAMLRDRACPSCLHNMKDAREEGDGCTVCPECGAAWHLPADAPSTPLCSDHATSPRS